MRTLNNERTRILSVGTFLPEEVVSSRELFEEIRSEQQYGIASDWMEDKMGIIERRLSAPATLPSELAIPAALEALTNSGVNKELINLLIFCGIERDRPEPATAHTIQQAIGTKADYVFDVANACYGFADGVEIATAFISTGIVSHALVVTGEVPSRVVRSVTETLRKGVPVKQASKMIGMLSVGDAGGAIVLGPCERESSSGFMAFKKNVNSRHLNKCHYEVDEDGKVTGQMLMEAISAYGFKMHRDIIGETMSMAGWDRFDWMLSHQPGKKNFEQIASLNIVSPTHIIKTYERFGNTTSATFPLSFKKLITNAKVKKGDRIGGCFAGSGLTVGQFCYTY